MVSPPTRGWTVVRPLVRREHPGFPAHAGMDQVGKCVPLRSSGFPAHAGMDLYLNAKRTTPDGFPRPRGDGPPDDVATLFGVGVSPPTRGWTSAMIQPPDLVVSPFETGEGDVVGTGG